jgi:hypothetical protein
MGDTDSTAKEKGQKTVFAASISSITAFKTVITIIVSELSG